MERTAALALTSRIENTWSDRPWPGAKQREWTDALESIDETAAGTTLVRLRATQDHCPSIAAFLAAARRLDQTDGSKPRDVCDCANGWVEAAPLEQDETVYTQVQPCPRCSDGRRMEQSAVWQQRDRGAA